MEPSTEPLELVDELRELASALRRRIEVEKRHGVRGVRAAPAAVRVCEIMPDRARRSAAVPDARSNDEGIVELFRGVATKQTGRRPASLATGGIVSQTLRREAVPGLSVVRADLGDCTRCKLHTGREQIVFGVGSETAALMFIGEAPGRDEDEQGEPFVGRAGQLLTKMIEAMGLTRDEVYIANIAKCRPPDNRAPEPDEVAACEPFLRRQIDAIRPRILVLLGGVAAQTLLRTKTSISALRGRFHSYQGVMAMPTFHPAFLLRSPHMKKPVWEDLKLVMAKMDRLGLKRHT